MAFTILFWNVYHLGTSSSDEKKKVFYKVLEEVPFDIMCLVELSDNGYQVLSDACKEVQKVCCSFDFYNTGQKNLNYGIIQKTDGFKKQEYMFKKLDKMLLKKKSKYETKNLGGDLTFGPRPIVGLHFDDMLVMFTHAPAYEKGGEMVVSGIIEWMIGEVFEKKIIIVADFNAGFSQCLLKNEKKDEFIKSGIKLVSPGLKYTHKEGKLIDYAISKGVSIDAVPVNMSKIIENKLLNEIDHLPVRYNVK